MRIQSLKKLQERENLVKEIKAELEKGGDKIYFLFD